MMELKDRQYENVARHLDGEQVVLDRIERVAADEVRDDEKAVASVLGVAGADGAIDRACRLVRKKLVRNTFRRVRLAFYSGVSTAAALLLTIGVARLVKEGVNLVQPAPPRLVELFEEDFWREPRIELLARQIDELETEMAVAGEPVMDAEIKSLEPDIDAIERFGDESSGMPVEG